VGKVVYFFVLILASGNCYEILCTFISIQFHAPFSRLIKPGNAEIIPKNVVVDKS